VYGHDINESVNEIADELRAAAGDTTKTQDVMARLFAENIDLRHVPPLPSDGPIPGRLLAEVSRREVAAVERALRNRVDSDSEVTVDGDQILVRSRTRGTLDDGTSIDVRPSTRFTVAGGAIVGLQSDMDGESMEAWGKVLAAGGFEIPADVPTS
jgi:hypothetical protein